MPGHRTPVGLGVPEDVAFAAEPRLAWAMSEAALGAGSTASWFIGDEVYGQDSQLRSVLEARGVGYVLAVACTTRVRMNQDRTVVQADTDAAALPQGAWQRQSTGAGAKGSRYCDWARVQIGPDHNRSLLVRRNPATSELAFYPCWSTGEGPCPHWCSPPGSSGASKSASKPQRGRPAWTITRFATGHPGTAPPRYTTLAMLAMVFLAAVAAGAKSATGPDPNSSVSSVLAASHRGVLRRQRLGTRSSWCQ